MLLEPDPQQIRVQRMRFRSTVFFVAAFFLSQGGSNAAHAATVAATAEPLLYPENLKFIGAFKLPDGTSNQTSFSFAARGLAFDPIRNALFISGHSWYQYTAEVSIPTPVDSTNIASLPTATGLQPLTDALDGKLAAINPTASSGQSLGGYLVYNNELIISAYSYYDGNASQVASHFVRPLNLSSGSVSGPYRIGPLYPGFVSGYMTLVPSEWQSLLGGPALTGNCCLNVISEQSSGPSLSVFDPASLSGAAAVNSTELVGYPIQNPLAAYNSTFTQSTASDGGTVANGNYFNGTTRVTGVVFPPGTRSVLFFGKQGMGNFCYGQGTTDQAIVGQEADGPSDLWCYDPAGSAKGTHAYPYEFEVWAYDANDLLQVKEGNEEPYQIRPYAVWTLNPPINPDNNRHLDGAAYDPATNRLFVAQQCGDGNCTAIIDVYQIVFGSQQGAVPSVPSSPLGVKVQ